jgi:hypothetical protein
MPESKYQSTWISLAERPPPATLTKPRLLLRFRTKVTQEIEMGYYLGDGKVRILGHHIGRQLPLMLDEMEAWMPVNAEQLQEIENAELGPDPASERYVHRGNEAPRSGRNCPAPAQRQTAEVGFADLEDYAEWAGIDQETEEGADPGDRSGNLFPG